MGTGKPNKPRIPAAVRHEVEKKEREHDAEDDRRQAKVKGKRGKEVLAGRGGGKEVSGLKDEVDDSRLQYRGFDKSKLNNNRKKLRKEQRDGKKRARCVPTSYPHSWNKN